MLKVLDVSKTGEARQRVYTGNAPTATPEVTSKFWSSLEISDYFELHLIISDIDSFVRDTGSFMAHGKS